MQLDKFSDYALRVLVALTVAPNAPIPSSVIAQRYGLSEHHIAKVATQLVRHGFIVSDRGRGGGLRLARDATAIRIGSVLQAIKSNEPVVECMGTNQTCAILPACGLRTPLVRAKDAFYAVLDEYTLADVTTQHSALAQLLSFDEKIAPCANITQP